MKSITFLLSLLLLASIAFAKEPPRPNIVYLLVDDLGWSDCGFMGGQEIHTP